MSQSATSQAASGIDDIIARGVQLATARQLPELAEILPDLEKVYPVTEGQWQSLLQIYAAAAKPVWTEIATKRFLEKEPNNIRARLKEVELLYRMHGRKNESLEKLEALEGDDINRLEDLILAARVSIQCHKVKEARAYFERAFDLDPKNYNTRLYSVAQYLMFRYDEEAREGIHALMSLEEYNIGALNSIVTFSLRVKEVRHAKHVLSVAVRRINEGNNDAKAMLLDNAIKMEEYKSATHILGSIDIPSMRTEKELAGLYSVIEGRGYRREENLIFERAAALNVTNGRLGEMLRQLSQPGAGFLDAKMAAPPAAGVFGRAFHALRTRLSGSPR